MPSENDPAADVDHLIARLQQRVAERRAAGVYPADLERNLDAHFERIAAHRPEPYDFERLRTKLGALDEAMGFSPARIAYESGVPGGAAMHRAVAKAVSRQTGGILEQLHRFAASLRDVVDEVVAAVEHPNSHVHAELLGQVDSLMERMASLERMPADGVVGVADLRERVERLEAAEAARRFEPWYSNDRFQEQFRGAEDDILDRYADLASRFDGAGKVVDLGCGRGEFLELLRDRGVEAIGVEIDAELAATGRAKGLEVVHADAVEWLAAEPDESLGGIALVQVIEHLQPSARADVVRLAASKLRRGGRLLIETLNPQSLYIYARALYVDPTHDRPVHPAYLDFLVREAGFSQVAVEWRSQPQSEETLVEVPGEGAAVDAANENVRRVNALLFGPQDFAIFAVR